MKEYYEEHQDEIKMNSNIFSREKRKKEDGLINYDLPRKNFIRNEIIDIMDHYSIKTILTLESPDFLFSKQVLGKKIFVFEENSAVYNKMLKKKPRNVQLFLGDIINFSNLPFNVDFVYLDFCSTMDISLEKVEQLKEKIQNAKLFALTICLRHVRTKGDYEFYLLNKLQTLTEINWKVIYGESYRENLGDKSLSSPMLTILLENPNIKNGNLNSI
jgi:hypothetical protein